MRETLIGCLPHMPWPVIEPTIFWHMGCCSNQLTCPAGSGSANLNKNFLSMGPCFYFPRLQYLHFLHFFSGLSLTVIISYLLFFSRRFLKPSPSIYKPHCSSDLHHSCWITEVPFWLPFGPFLTLSLSPSLLTNPYALTLFQGSIFLSQNVFQN